MSVIIPRSKKRLRFGCHTCRKEVKYKSDDTHLTCCGHTERRPDLPRNTMSDTVRDFLKPNLGSHLDQTVGDKWGLSSEECEDNDWGVQ